MTTYGHFIGVWPTPQNENGRGYSTRPNEKGGAKISDHLKRTSTPTPTPSTSSQQEFPASQPPAPGSKEARKMTAGSGRRLYESFAKSRPLGAFLRILLESETWHSTEFYLTWKLKATKSKCLVFQLAPSMPRTGANATGLSEGAWPTPRRRDIKDTGDGEWAMERTDGKSRTDQLPHAVKTTWPTPDASKAGKTSRSGDRKDEPLIGGLVRSAWTTPQKHDVTGRSDTQKAIHGTKHGCACLVQDAKRIGIISSGCLAQTEKFAVRLTTLSAWLMGYTGAYLAHWETASSRRSRKG